jgi:hypothetical protein
MAQVSLLPGRQPGRLGGQHPRPTPTAPRRDIAVDAIQARLGEALVLLVGLAVVLFAVILLLLEAEFILRLWAKLAQRLRSSGSMSRGSRLIVNDSVTAGCVGDERGES